MNNPNNEGRKGGLYGIPGGLLAAAYNRERDHHVVQNPLVPSVPLDRGPMICICPDGGLNCSPIGECQRCHRKPVRLMSLVNQAKFYDQK